VAPPNENFVRVRIHRKYIHLGLQEHVNDDIFIHITKPDGTEAIVPRAAQITLETVRWESKPAAFLFRMISSGKDALITDSAYKNDGCSSPVFCTIKEKITMKVLFAANQAIALNHGGIRTQIEQTKSALESLGVTVTLSTCGSRWILRNSTLCTFSPPT
jgi:hypothetical protein